jgi:hypothetical protein
MREYMELRLSFSGDVNQRDATTSLEWRDAIFLKLLALGFPDPRPPDEVRIDVNKLYKKIDTIYTKVPKRKQRLSVFWRKPTRYHAAMYSAPKTTKTSHQWNAPGQDRPAQDLLPVLEELPFAWMGNSSRSKVWGGSGKQVEYDRGRGFGYGHYGHGWLCAFKGEEGHNQLVSRRWLEYGPWHLIKGKNDLSLIEFHDPLADDLVQLKQARAGHELIGQSPWGGFIPLSLRFVQADLFKTYDPLNKSTVVVMTSRDFQPWELNEAAALKHFFHDREEQPIHQVRYVFMDEKEARKKLHMLWLHNLSCHTFINGREVDLMEDYEPPPPVVPDWVKRVQDREGV